MIDRDTLFYARDLFDAGVGEVKYVLLATVLAMEGYPRLLGAFVVVLVACGVLLAYPLDEDDRSDDEPDRPAEAA